MNDNFTNGTISQDEKTFGLLAHLLGIFGFIGPLIIWLLKKDQSRFVDENGKNALNFQLTLLIGYIIGAILTVILIGPVLNSIIYVVGIIFSVVNGVKANNGETPKYPFAIQFLK